MLRAGPRGSTAEPADLKADKRWESARRVVETAEKLPRQMREKVIAAQRSIKEHNDAVRNLLWGRTRRNTSQAALWTIVMHITDTTVRWRLTGASLRDVGCCTK